MKVSSLLANIHGAGRYYTCYNIPKYATITVSVLGRNSYMCNGGTKFKPNGSNQPLSVWIEEPCHNMKLTPSTIIGDEPMAN